jgi:hypothetical protein
MRGFQSVRLAAERWHWRLIKEIDGLMSAEPGTAEGPRLDFGGLRPEFRNTRRNISLKPPTAADNVTR